MEGGRGYIRGGGGQGSVHGATGNWKGSGGVEGEPDRDDGWYDLIGGWAIATTRGGRNRTTGRVKVLFVFGCSWSPKNVMSKKGWGLGGRGVRWRVGELRRLLVIVAGAVEGEGLRESHARHGRVMQWSPV